MQLVTLQNQGRTPLTLILPHDTACAEGHCICGQQAVGTSELNPESGELSSQIRSKRMPMSVQIFGGETSQPLPETVKRCPDVIRAFRSGALRVELCKLPAPPVEGTGAGAAAPQGAPSGDQPAASGEPPKTEEPPADEATTEANKQARRGRNQER